MNKYIRLAINKIDANMFGEDKKHSDSFTSKHMIQLRVDTISDHPVDSTLIATHS